MADKIEFSRVSTLLVDCDHAYRQAMYSMLRGIGFKNIKQLATLGEIEHTFSLDSPDLLISESELPDGDFCKFIYGLRHSIVGDNPFLPVLALTAKPTGPLVRRIVDSGSDDLLTKPLSANQLRDRITALIKARKPFVVTSDYIGPTRRTESDRQASKVPLIEVPNILREKAIGARSPSGTQKAINDAIHEINHQKLERYAGQILYLAERIVPALLEQDGDDTVRRHIARLDYVAGDTSRRLVGTKYQHVSELCDTLINTVKGLRKTGNNGAATSREARLLMPLATAIKAGFETGTVRTAREIVASLSEQ